MVKASEYFGRIPEWDAKKPEDSFAICKGISPLPVTRLEHWQDFQGFIENRYNRKLSKDLIFRGQRRYDWKLISSLGRSKISNFGIDSENRQLENFRQAIRGRIQDHSLLKEKLSKDEENELWSIGQHHGLMTPLLDWTYSPYLALFFAFIEEDTIEESLMPNYYRSVYILDSFYFKKSIKDSRIGIFEPTQDEYGRLVNQDGLFTISTLEIDIETEIYNSAHKFLKENSKLTEAYTIAKFACKVYIKNKDREECLQHLNYMNINHKSLFPDFHGSAHFCNYRITNFIYNLKKTITDGGSLIFLSERENSKYKKNKLYNRIEKNLNKILKDSLSDSEKYEIEKIDADVKKRFKENPLEGVCLVTQIEILAREITRQIERLKELPIPSHLYKDSMKAKIDLILTEFDLKGLKHIQDKKHQVINKIMAIIKEQNDKG